MTENKLSLASKLLYSTMKIDIRNKNSRWSGTGFLFEFQLSQTKTTYFLISNKHVLMPVEPSKMYLTFHMANPDHTPNNQNLMVECPVTPRFLVPHPDKNVDLCAFFLSPLIENLFAQKKEIFIQTLNCNLIPKDWSTFDSIEEVTMIGYPNGLSDQQNNFPIVRRGITATSVEQNKKKKNEFMIDMACFPGSSGSPVFILNSGGYFDGKKEVLNLIGNRLFLLGILYAGPTRTDIGTIEFKDIASIKFETMMHLGNVIKSTEILPLKSEIEKRMNKKLY